MANNKSNTGYRIGDPNIRKELERASKPVAATSTAKSAVTSEGARTPVRTGGGSKTNPAVATDLTIAEMHQDIIKKVCTRLNFINGGNVTWHISKVGTNNAYIMAEVDQQPVLEVLYGEVTCDKYPEDYDNFPNGTDWTTANGYHQNYLYGTIIHNWNLDNHYAFTLDLTWKILGGHEFQKVVRHYAADGNTIIVESPNDVPQTYYYTLVRYLTGNENEPGEAVEEDYANNLPFARRGVLGYRIAGENAELDDEFTTLMQVTESEAALLTTISTLIANTPHAAKEAVRAILFYTGSGATYDQVTFAGAPLAGVAATLTSNTNEALSTSTSFTKDVSSTIINGVGRRVFVVGNTGNTRIGGIYVITDTGSVSTPWVLTRATDFDEPKDIFPGVHFIITDGQTDVDNGYRRKMVVILSAPTEVGLSPLSYYIFNPKLYTDNIYLTDGSGNTIDNAIGDLETAVDDLQAFDSNLQKKVNHRGDKLRMAANMMELITDISGAAISSGYGWNDTYKGVFSTNGALFLHLNIFQPVVPGKTYRAKMWAQSAGIAADVLLLYYWHDVNYAPIGSYNIGIFTAVTTAIELSTAELTPPAGARYITYAIIPKNGGSATSYVQSVEHEEVFNDPSVTDDLAVRTSTDVRRKITGQGILKNARLFVIGTGAISAMTTQLVWDSTEKAVKVVAGSTSMLIDIRYPVSDDHSYQYKARIKHATSGAMQLLGMFWDGAGNYLGYTLDSFVNVTPGSSYATYTSAVFSPLAGATRMSINVYGDANNFLKWIDIDQVTGAMHTHAGADITQDSTHRFMTDAEKAEIVTISGTQTILGAKTHSALLTLTNDFYSTGLLQVGGALGDGAGVKGYFQATIGELDAVRGTSVLHPSGVGLRGTGYDTGVRGTGSFANADSIGVVGASTGANGKGVTAQGPDAGYDFYAVNTTGKSAFNGSVIVGGVTHPLSGYRASIIGASAISGLLISMPNSSVLPAIECRDTGGILKWNILADGTAFFENLEIGRAIDATAGALQGYVQFNINGTDYKLPLYAV